MSGVPRLDTNVNAMTKRTTPLFIGSDPNRQSVDTTAAHHDCCVVWAVRRTESGRLDAKRENESRGELKSWGWRRRGRPERATAFGRCRHDHDERRRRMARFYRATRGAGGRGQRSGLAVIVATGLCIVLPALQRTRVARVMAALLDRSLRAALAGGQSLTRH